ncbi:MAG: competence/damage-inducible protein A [Planctomycetes bacterium]|nr:competence/damage-inducible protein A [Planctomycetota bacterium]
MQAVILSIGDELVLGQTVDTNSAYLSADLVRMGIGTLYHQTIADDRSAIAKAIDRAAQSAPLIIVTGGLGPTDDDLTREALADAMGVDLVLDDASVSAIRAMFERRGRTMPDRNKVQAMHPRGTAIIPNSCGTAPGIHAVLHNATIYVTPGVPSEMVAMWELTIAPLIAKLGPKRGVILTQKISTFGLGESTVAEKLGPLMDRKRNPIVGTTVAGGVVSVRVRAEFNDPAQAQREMDDTVRQAEACLGHYVYGRGEAGLQDSLIALLKEKKSTLATAESCTGGLLGKQVTDVAGSSAAYLGGWITYSNEMKVKQLGVPEELLKKHGAVSQPVARAMAAGALAHAGADIAVGITGIAGPDGGTAEKPVGLVWIAVAWRNGKKETHTDAMRFDLGNVREIVRDRAAKSAMQMVRFHLMGLPIDNLTLGRRVAE